MGFEWAEAKRKANVRKHGIDFVGAERVFDGYTVTVEDTRFEYHEHRFITFGILEGRAVAVAHTERGDSIRFISIRKATKNEEKSYFAKIPEC
ncbi:MAG TPA: BrnT family toxin [Candidatus Binatia bacterium]